MVNFTKYRHLPLFSPHLPTFLSLLSLLPLPSFFSSSSLTHFQPFLPHLPRFLLFALHLHPSPFLFTYFLHHPHFHSLLPPQTFVLHPPPLPPPSPFPFPSLVHSTIRNFGSSSLFLPFTTRSIQFLLHLPSSSLLLYSPTTSHPLPLPTPPVSIENLLQTEQEKLCYSLMGWGCYFITP